MSRFVGSVELPAVPRNAVGEFLAAAGYPDLDDVLSVHIEPGEVAVEVLFRDGEGRAQFGRFPSVVRRVHRIDRGDGAAEW